LRQAATRLARGDLTARVGAKFSGRHDEAADLVREFDQMADRVALLIQAQRRLIADVSHEIKSPMARLNMALGLARRDAEPYAPKQFERMQREIDNISHLVRELLTLASLDAMDARMLDQPTNLGEVIGEVLTDIAYEMPDRASDLVVHEVGRDIIIPGDKALLRRAIENLLRNAVFYTNEGASIEIGCDSPRPDRVRISIRDHGPGVPEEALPHLFDPFYRVDDARTRQTGGTGMGLAICRRAVELHQGSVWARNIEPHGLEIVMDLPQTEANMTTTRKSTQLHDPLG
jgi:two-component system sensor histidine kinase CpxA